MSIFNSQLFENTPDGKQKISPNILAQWGPIVEIAISIPQALVELYTKEGKPVPQPQQGIALIDTGATKSGVHYPIMEALEVKPIGVAWSGTAGGQVKHNLYPAHFTFLAAKIEIDFTSVVGVNLNGQTVMEKPILALIGRDVLSLGLFVYNGSTGAYSFSV